MHHTGGKNWGDIDGREVRAFCVREGNNNPNAWYPTVYHFLIAKNGKVWNDAKDSQVIPHCGLDYNEYWLNNQNTIGVSVIGAYETEVMPDAQYYSVLDTVVKLKRKYPKAIFKLHRELISTDCPGKNYPFDKLMKDLGVCLMYKDVDPKAWYFKAISWMIQKGFIKGNEKGLIQPLKYVSKAELAQILYNKAEKEGKL
jgi:hypothetical protein